MQPESQKAQRTALFTLPAMLAFAANSLLCRAALLDAEIDPLSFTALRLASGAALLAFVVSLPARRAGRRGDGSAARRSRAADVAASPRPSRKARLGGDALSAAALFGYALFFSLAYVSLDAGTGALILFAFVQATMIGWGLWRGERPGRRRWLGLIAALAGLTLLLAPGLGAPSPKGAALMALAGISWGVYSLRGRGLADPLDATAGNFLRAAPPALLLLVPFALLAGDALALSPAGAGWAIASGALASGLGYVLWYAALRGFSATGAAIVQLSVPLIAALGGWLLLDEALTLRLALAGLLILGGIAAALSERARVR